MTQTSVTAGGALAAARRSALHPVLILLTAFLAVSVAMMAFLVVVTVFIAPIDIAVWIRCSFVLASAIVLLVCARGAARGSRSAWLRLAIIAPVIVVAVVVIVSIPGFLPGWVRIEQAVCGALVLPAAVIALLPRTRALFPRGA
ncbi:hypothetical protein [Gryllotalpicola protaetiae]|uniref:hypothetical protein n=1 Tax=Gryllotalpicola protaetiae TaxID=2419771 RepID=UPI0013C3F749|nr:hypothetical protein [Gryllotalpicola protaetiae]